MAKLPKPNAVFVTDKDVPDTPEMVRGLFCNPLYTGVLPGIPAMVSEEQWVSAATKIIRDEGAEQFLVNLLFLLREDMKNFELKS